MEMTKRKRHVKKKTLLDIIIPVHGRFDLLEMCLDALPSACGDITYTVIIVDNSSPKSEADKFYSDRKGVTVIRNKSNKGFPHACRQGANRGHSPLLLFLNSDVIMDTGSIDQMVRALDEKEIGIVGAKLLFPEFVEGLRTEIRPAGKVQHVGLMTNIRGEFVHAYVGWNADNPRVNQVREVYAVTGAALMTRRLVWKDVGGFDLKYGMGTWEDVDFCLSARDLGYNVIVEIKATGVHYTGATSEAYQIGYPYDQNRMIFMSKWGGVLNWTEYLHW